MRHRLFIALSVVVTVVGGGCSSTAPRQGVGPFGVRQDRLYPGDKLTIHTEENPPAVLSSRSFDTTVQPDGTVTVVSNKVFRAAGKTVGEFRREVRAYYVPKRLKSVTILDLSTFDFSAYFVSGEVESPGPILFGGRAPSLRMAIVSVGGFTPASNKKKVQLIRADGEQFTIDCTDTRRQPAEHMEVYPGDHVFVPRSSKWLFW